MSASAASRTNQTPEPSVRNPWEDGAGKLSPWTKELIDPRLKHAHSRLTVRGTMLIDLVRNKKIDAGHLHIMSMLHAYVGELGRESIKVTVEAFCQGFVNDKDQAPMVVPFPGSIRSFIGKLNELVCLGLINRTGEVGKTQTYQLNYAAMGEDRMALKEGKGSKSKTDAHKDPDADQYTPAPRPMPTPTPANDGFDEPAPEPEPKPILTLVPKEAPPAVEKAIASGFQKSAVARENKLEKGTPAQRAMVMWGNAVREHYPDVPIDLSTWEPYLQKTFNDKFASCTPSQRAMIPEMIEMTVLNWTALRSKFKTFKDYPPLPKIKWFIFAFKDYLGFYMDRSYLDGMAKRSKDHYTRMKNAGCTHMEAAAAVAKWEAEKIVDDARGKQFEEAKAQRMLAAEDLRKAECARDAAARLLAAKSVNQSIRGKPLGGGDENDRPFDAGLFNCLSKDYQDDNA